MASITELLSQILHARYGKDVRQSIHDAIKTCYEDGKAGATDLIARADASEAKQGALDALSAVQAETVAREMLEGRVDTVEEEIQHIDVSGFENASGNPLSLETSEGGIRLKRLVGETHKSPNLIPFPYYRQSGYVTNGITWTVDGDGTIVANGTATTTAFFNLTGRETEELKDGETYTLVLWVEGTRASVYINNGTKDVVAMRTAVGYYSTSFVYEKGSQNSVIVLYITSMDIHTNTKIKVMLVEGAEALPYEPYGITSAGGAMIDGQYAEVIKEHNHNLIPYPYTYRTRTLYGVNFIENSDGSITINGTNNGTNGDYAIAGLSLVSNIPYMVAVEENHTYMCVVQTDKQLPSGCFVAVNGWSDNQMTENYFNSVSVTKNIPFKIKNGTKYVCCYISNRIGYVFDNVTIKVMLVEVAEDGTYPTEFHKREEHTTIIPLSSPLNGFNGIYDYIDENGEVHKIGSVDLGSLSGWNESGALAHRFYVSAPTSIKFLTSIEIIPTNILSNKYTVVSSRTISATPPNKSISLDTENHRIVFYDTDISLSKIPSALNGNILYYELATETVTPLTTDQIKALNSLVSFESATYLETADGLGILDVDYSKSDIGAKVLEHGNTLTTKANADEVEALKNIMAPQGNVIVYNGLNFALAKSGKVCILTCISGTTTNSISASGVVFVLPDGYKPLTQTEGIDIAQSARLIALTNGTIIVNKAIGAGVGLRFSTTYITK